MTVRQKPYPDSVMERATLLRDSLDTALVAELFPLFDATDNANFFAMSLHATIIELTSACYELFCVGHIHAMPMVLRSAQDALVDLHCLIEDADYAEHMAADWVGTAYALPDVMSRSDRQALQGMVKDRRGLRRVRRRVNSRCRILHLELASQHDYGSAKTQDDPMGLSRVSEDRRGHC